MQQHTNTPPHTHENRNDKPILKLISFGKLIERRTGYLIVCHKSMHNRFYCDDSYEYLMKSPLNYACDTS